jgi:hypothetical protein
MGKNSTSAGRRFSHLVAIPVSFNVKIEMRNIDNLYFHVLSDQATNLTTMYEVVGRTHNIIFRVQSFPAQESFVTELAPAQFEEHEAPHDHYSKSKTKPNKCAALGNVGRRLALVVAKGGLWSLIGWGLLKMMAFCEGIAGTVDFMQMVGQGLACFLGLF